MIPYENEAERAALLDMLEKSYMEIFPTPTIADRLQALEPGTWIGISCSPTRGVDATLALTRRLIEQGFHAVPHLSARMVRDRAHLREIMAFLGDLPVDSIFVPGGDGEQPLGKFFNAFDLLREIAGYDHGFAEIGVAAHPEGHPDVEDERLMVELEKKQPLATYLVTQLCFDPIALDNWINLIRERGIHLPAWIGIPGEADRMSLLKTSMRIGVGESLRLLRGKSSAAARLVNARTYSPDELLGGLAHLLANPINKIDGFHLFSFNLVDSCENWRRRKLQQLR